MKVTDAFYATIGAPVLAGRKLVEVGGKAVVAVRDGVEASTVEGRTVADKFGDGNMVEELNTRLEVDERVGKLRDQVESVVERWREGFQADKKAETAKSTAKKTPAKKTTAKKAPTKKAAAKKAPAKKTTPKPVAEETMATADETMATAEDKVDINV